MSSTPPPTSPTHSSLLQRRRHQYQQTQQQDTNKQNLIKFTTFEREEKWEEKKEEGKEEEDVEGFEGAVKQPNTMRVTLSDHSLIRIRPGDAYNQLPVDLIHLMAQFLDGRSLARLGSCDHTNQIVSAKPQLWKYLIENTELEAEWLDLTVDSRGTMRTLLSFEMLIYRSKQIDKVTQSFVRMLAEIQAGNTSSISPDHNDQLEARQEYITRYQLVAKLKRYASDKWKQRCLEQQGRWRVKLMDLLEEVLMRPFLIALVGWQLFLIIRALDAASPPCLHISTFLPLLLATFLILASFLNLFYIKWRSSTCHTPNQQHTINASSTLTLPDVDTSWHFLPASYISRSQSGIARITCSVVGYSNAWQTLRAHSLLIATVFMLALFVFLLTLRMTLTINLSWTFIFLPFYLAFFLLQVGCYRFDWHPLVNIRMNGAHLGWSLTICILVATVFALVINLWLVYREVYDRTFHYILSPLYFLFIGATIEWTWWRRSDLAHEAKRIGLPLWLMGLVPMTITAILLGMKMDGYQHASLNGFDSYSLDLTWQNTLMPLLIPITCLFVRSLMYMMHDILGQLEMFAHALMEPSTPMQFDMPIEVKSNK